MEHLLILLLLACVMVLGYLNDQMHRDIEDIKEMVEEIHQKSFPKQWEGKDKIKVSRGPYGGTDLNQ